MSCRWRPPRIRRRIASCPATCRLLVRTVAVLLQAKEVDGARALLDEAQQRGLQSPDLDKLGMQVDFQKGNLAAVEQCPGETGSAAIRTISAPC